MKKTKVLIIGSGPAGYTAAVYAARANLKPIIALGDQPGGQLTITTDVENYPGFADTIQGPWLMEQMQEQAKNSGSEMLRENISKVDFSNRPFKAWTSGGEEIEAESVIISTGAQAKWLGLDSEKKFLGYGVSGCATCDGFFFREQEVAVVGGGNTAVEEALFLTNFAKKVHLIHRRDSLRAEKITQDKLFKNEKVVVHWNKTLEEVVGTDEPKTVTGIKIKDTKTDEISDIELQGVFIAIGHKPQSSLFKDQLDMDSEGYLIAKPGSTKTNIEGVFAAGDVQDKIFRQAVTAAGQGCMAALEAEKFLN